MPSTSSGKATPLAKPSSCVPCAHCGLETPLGDPATVTCSPPTVGSEPHKAEATAVQPLVFCCRGCMGAYAMIHDLGLEDFYALRRGDAADPHPVRGVRRADVLADLEAAGVPVERWEDGLCRVRLAVDGLHCAACTWLIESMQPSMPGVKSARVRLSDSTIELLYDPERTAPMQIAERLGKLGYALGPIDRHEVDETADAMLQREHWIGMAVAFFLAANAMWIGISLYAGESSGIAPEHECFLRWMGALLGLLSAVFPGRIFFRSAWASIRAGVPHVDVPVAIGLAVGTLGSIVGAAVGRGHVYFDSLASLVLLLRVGRYIQFRAQYRTGLSIGQLLRMQSVIAQRIEPDGGRLSVPSYRLREKDLVEVLPGQIVPADGVVVEGRSALQNAFITGESLPSPIQAGGSVVGGSLNLQSPITVRVTAAGDASRMGRLAEMVRHATAQRTPLIDRANRVGGIFVWVVLGLSVLTFAYWRWSSGWEPAIEHTVALLTIACPCALALAAPLVITVALGRAARQKIWIRDGGCLEHLATPGMLWFDKTGTLTYGDLRVIEWSGDDACLVDVFAIEQQSDHPAARAIVAYIQELHPEVREKSIAATRVEQRYGSGIGGVVSGREVSLGLEVGQEDSTHASPHQSIGVCIDGVKVGRFLLGDQSRHDAAEALLALQSRGWKLGILSGDRQSVVDAVAEPLRAQGIVLQAAMGDCSPEEKLEVIQRNKSEHPVTVMVGDGINDAAALAAADVGIAIRGVGETCLRNAPIYIPSHQLRSIVRLMDASRNTVSGIYRCFAASLLYNTITISLAVSGWIHPLIAALFMPLSGLTVLTMALTAKTFPSESRSEGSAPGILSRSRGGTR